MSHRKVLTICGPHPEEMRNGSFPQMAHSQWRPKRNRRSRWKTMGTTLWLLSNRLGNRRHVSWIRWILPRISRKFSVFSPFLAENGGVNLLLNCKPLRKFFVFLHFFRKKGGVNLLLNCKLLRNYQEKDGFSQEITHRWKLGICSPFLPENGWVLFLQANCWLNDVLGKKTKKV